MQIRLAIESDIPVIREILKRNFDEVISKDHSSEVVEKFKAHNAEETLLHQLSWKRVYVAEIDNQVVGTGAFANLTYTDKPNYCISNLYVLPEYQRKGVGCSLVKVLFNDFEKTGDFAFHVPSTRGAVAFYSKFGFTVDDIQNDIADEITWMTYRSEYYSRNCFA